MIEMDTDRKWWVKEKVSVGELHGPKLRGVTVNSPKICSCTVKLCPEKNIILNISSLKQLSFMIINLALRDNGLKDRELSTNQIIIYTSSTYVKPYQNIL